MLAKNQKQPAVLIEYHTSSVEIIFLDVTVEDRLAMINTIAVNQIEYCHFGSLKCLTVFVSNGDFTTIKNLVKQFKVYGKDKGIKIKQTGLRKIVE